MMYAAFCGLVAMPCSAGDASRHDLFPAMMKDAQCMVGVLQTVPGATHIKLGVTNLGNYAHPYVEYDAPPENGKTQTIIFNSFLPDAENWSGNSPYFFLAYLNGLFTPGGPPPSSWGTGVVVERFRKECHADVNALFT
jgi:hypothetical protein